MQLPGKSQEVPAYKTSFMSWEQDKNQCAARQTVQAHPSVESAIAIAHKGL